MQIKKIQKENLAIYYGLWGITFILLSLFISNSFEILFRKSKLSFLFLNQIPYQVLIIYLFFFLKSNKIKFFLSIHLLYPLFLMVKYIKIGIQFYLNHFSLLIMEFNIFEIFFFVIFQINIAFYIFHLKAFFRYLAIALSIYFILLVFLAYLLLIKKFFVIDMDIIIFLFSLSYIVLINFTMSSYLYFKNYR